MTHRILFTLPVSCAWTAHALAAKAVPDRIISQAIVGSPGLALI